MDEIIRIDRQLNENRNLARSYGEKAEIEKKVRDNNTGGLVRGVNRD